MRQSEEAHAEGGKDCRRRFNESQQQQRELERERERRRSNKKEEETEREIVPYEKPQC